MSDEEEREFSEEEEGDDGDLAPVRAAPAGGAGASPAGAFDPASVAARPSAEKGLEACTTCLLIKTHEQARGRAWVRARVVVAC